MSHPERIKALIVIALNILLLSLQGTKFPLAALIGSETLLHDSPLLVGRLLQESAYRFKGQAYI